MIKYSCERCGKEFSQKSHYDSHNRRKTPCDNKMSIGYEKAIVKTGMSLLMWTG